MGGAIYSGELGYGFNSLIYIHIYGWYAVDYPFQWGVKVDIFGVLFCLVESYGWHEAFPTVSVRDKLCAPTWWSISCLHLFHVVCLEELVIKYDLVPLSIGIKANLIISLQLCGFLLNCDEVKGGGHYMLQVWGVCRLAPWVLFFSIS